ncbi:hypothetical protein BVRB_5g101010 [Beta vulgaris subsp. vulgaris]|nr:hypothetical protein BVRB_5g101010 [Beta vulgaris subsp. vulgaris]
MEFMVYDSTTSELGSFLHLSFCCQFDEQVCFFTSLPSILFANQRLFKINLY